MFPKNLSTGIGWLLSSSKKALLSSSVSFFGISPSFKLDLSESTVSQLSSSLLTWLCRFSLLSVFEGALLDFSANGFKESLCSFSCLSSPVSGMLSSFFCWVVLQSPESSECESSADVFSAAFLTARFPVPHVRPSSSDFTRLFFSHFSLFEGCLSAALREEDC